MMKSDPQLKKRLRLIIAMQCAGSVSMLLFQNGFALTYALKLGIAPHSILSLFAMLPLLGMLLTLPLAYASDRFGKKRMGLAGVMLSLIGFLLLPAAPILPWTAAGLWIGILIFSAGNAAGTASWFALLSPIIPAEIRGRFFGRLRVSWQTFGLLFSLAVAALLKWNESVRVYQLILAATALLLAVRLVLYRRIPELEPPCASDGGFLSALTAVLRIPGYLPFCFYLFLIALFTGSAVMLFGLLEKQVLGFSDSRIVVMGNLLAFGSIAGFFAGGRWVDRAGTRPVFSVTHGLFALVLAGFCLRGLLPCDPVWIVGLLTVLFGAVNAAFGIASTSEVLALIPMQDKSLATGFFIALTMGGVALSNLLIGQLLQPGVLASQWQLGGLILSEYDTVLLGSALLVMLSGAAVRLVPALLNVRSQSLPGSRR